MNFDSKKEQRLRGKKQKRAIFLLKCFDKCYVLNIAVIKPIIYGHSGTKCEIIILRLVGHMQMKQQMADIRRFQCIIIFSVRTVVVNSKKSAFKGTYSPFAFNNSSHN
jgi:hypothetical protein